MHSRRERKKKCKSGDNDKWNEIEHTVNQSGTNTFFSVVGEPERKAAYFRIFLPYEDSS